MTGPAGIVVVGLLWAAVLYRTWCLPKGPRSAQRIAMWLGILALALAATMFQPAVYRAFDEVVGVPNLAELVGHGLILVSAWQGHAILVFLIHPRRSARWRTWVYGALVAVVVAVMAIFFNLAPVDQEAPQTFTAVYAGAPYIVPYWLAFLAMVNYLLADIVRLVARYGSRSPNEHVRLGLHLVAVGGTFGVGYWLHWSIYLVLRQAQMPIPNGLRTAGMVCMFGGVLFIALGSTVPALGPRVGLPTPYAWWASLRHYRQLDPLWRALTTAAPEVVLKRPPRMVLDARFWLTRRLVEIEDALRLCMPNGVAHRERETRGRPWLHGRSPAAEAAMIRQVATTPRQPAGAASPPHANPTDVDVAASYDNRLRWHLEVSRAYAQEQRRSSGHTARRLTPLPRKEVDNAT
jgi:hypothetical protein